MVFGVEWVFKYCWVRYILKVDEDLFVNIFEVIKLFKKYDCMYLRNIFLYVGVVFFVKEFYWDKESKFYVLEKDYFWLMFFLYVVGVGYVFSGNLLRNFFIVLKVVKLFFNEDVCFGVLM